MLFNFKDSEGVCYSVCRFYGCLLTAVCLLYTAPVGLILSVLSSALFLWNRNFCRGQYVNARRGTLHVGQKAHPSVWTRPYADIKKISEYMYRFSIFIQFQ